MALHQRLGIEHPILQAPMAGAQDSRMAIAVARAGGLGALPCAMLPPEAMTAELGRIRAATTAPINVNFFTHTPRHPNPAAMRRWHEMLRPYYEELDLDPDDVPAGVGRRPFDSEACDALEPFQPAVVSFHFGLPAEDLLARVRSWSSLVVSSATTVPEARWLAAHGADAMRFTLCQMTTQTQDVRMPVERDDVSGKNTSPKFDFGRNFCTKLWNATRFALMNLEAASPSATSGGTGGPPVCLNAFPLMP